MMFHASISAHDPERVARFVAALWRGEAHPFPICPGAWIALANDDRRTALEVNPFGMEMVQGESEVGYAPNPAASPTSTCHQAIATPLDEDEVVALARAEGWRTRRCLRGLPDAGFEVIEVWLENRILVEVLTAPMQRRYLDFLAPGRWPEFLARVGAAG